ncbi:MAG: hypothetical protein KAY22_18600 [Rhizorhabdus sp.]|uniref:hypothetical protein n=1 Tax=Rhizorhabdus sp. TaxID=1968843 RepID=UPI001B6A662E|nr:hypothetical protein [Rhizorhabdus sp.]MBP8234310.1 hypothetical protein [Rhizorhabdus sp.]
MNFALGHITAGLAALAVVASAAGPVEADTLALGAPGALYTFDTASGATTPLGVAVRGNVTGWAAPRPVKQTADGALICTADSSGAYCINAATKALAGSVTTTLSQPYGWDVGQDGRRLVAAGSFSINGSNQQGVRIVDLTTGGDVATLGYETYAVAISPSGLTATALVQDISDTSAIFAGKIPYMLATIDLASGNVTRTAPLKAADGSRVYGPWALHGLADTGAGSFVLWNKGSFVMLVSADGSVSKSIAAAGVNVLVMAADGAAAYVANGTTAQRISLASGSVTNDYADGQVTGVAVPATADRLYTTGPVGGLPAATVGTWTVSSGTLALRQATADAAITSVSAVPPVRQLALPETGWWWNSASAGTGFSIECSSARKCFIGDFTYVAGGQAVWYVTSCELTSANTCTGTIDAYRGGITLGGTYQAPTGTAGAAGTMSVSFTSSTAATVTVTGRTPFQISRFAINGSAIGAAPSFAPQNGWWWAADEPGRGWFIETQNQVVQSGTTYGQLYLAGYMYETDGRSVWYLAQGLYTAVGTFGGTIPLFEGALTEFAGGPPLTGGSGTGVTVAGGRGATTVQFASATAGTIRLPNGRTIPITRFAIP